MLYSLPSTTMSNFILQPVNEQYVRRFLNHGATTCTKAFAVLKLYVNAENPELVDLYRQHVSNHNNKITNSEFPDVGFDLFIPETAYFQHPFETQFLNLQVKTEMIHTKPIVSLNSSTSFARTRDLRSNVGVRGILSVAEGEDLSSQVIDDATVGDVGNVGFLVYPRSSISKTPLMLANQTGVIDPGYRGDLISAIRYLSFPSTDNNNNNNNNNNIENVYELEKYTRLLQIVHPELLPIYVIMVDEDDLSTTDRGDGGFGSTGTRGVIL